ncbi:hypothetical protein BKA62DRAFT_764380 [Auriculariales sp. MPI-PUGE-AT-0066]|nr:hypothetical protein BKA62DRAFT_764380 [Auriculariales sp. MPI-PUGE-AT-0066]
MGVPGLWEVLRPASQTKSLTQLAVVDGFQRNHGGHRGFRVGIDASIWFFHASSAFTRKADVGENPELRTLFFRCAKLMGAPFLPLLVFDGPKRPSWKRGKRVNKSDSWLVTGAKGIIDAFGYEYHFAPGEAEAELAYLNRIGVIDAVLTDDVDTLLFGATMIIRNPSNTLSGNRANPVKNAEGRDDGNHVHTYLSADIEKHDNVGLTHHGLILIGLLHGGDYDTGGVSGFGVKHAQGLARCGFGDTLVHAVQTLNGAALDRFLESWRNDVRSELRTNSRGIIGKKLKSLADKLHDSFPNLEVVRAYADPIISASFDKFPTFHWRSDPDLSDLAALCEQYFEWGYREAILKRFRTLIWPGMVCRILRRSTLQSDDLAEAAERRRPSGISSTPTKRCHVVAQGTPSALITNNFSRLDVNSPVLQRFKASDATLIVKIHSERQHVSTDKLKEYRLEIAPLQLATLAEHGIKGTRPAVEANPWMDDEGEDADGDGDEEGPKKSRVPKPPPPPEAVLRIWMPAAMVELVEPRIVAEFSNAQGRKQQKKEGKGKARTAESSVSPPKPARKAKASTKTAAQVFARPPEGRYAFLGGSDLGPVSDADENPLSVPAFYISSRSGPSVEPRSTSEKSAAPAASGAAPSLASTSTLTKKKLLSAETFFSDEDDLNAIIPSANHTNAAKPMKKKKSSLPKSSATAPPATGNRTAASCSAAIGVNDVFVNMATGIGATARRSCTTSQTTTALKHVDFSTTPVQEETNTIPSIRKSPRKNKEHSSSRKPHHGNQTIILTDDDDFDLPTDRRIHSSTTIQAFPMQLPTAKPKAKFRTTKAQTAQVDIIVISSSDNENDFRPTRKPPPRIAAVHILDDDVIDLT